MLANVEILGLRFATIFDCKESCSNEPDEIRPYSLWQLYHAYI